MKSNQGIVWSVYDWLAAGCRPHANLLNEEARLGTWEGSAMRGVEKGGGGSGEVEMAERRTSRQRELAGSAGHGDNISQEGL